MKDPFFIAPIPWLVDWAEPWCQRLGLPTLPLHIHEVLAAALLYSVIFWPLSPIISSALAPRHYAKLPRKRRLNWDAHVVSMFQSVLINGLAIWVMFVDDERRSMNWEERVWGYTGAAGMIQALAAGYFVWDLFVTSLNLDVFGLGTLAHAIAALLVYALGFVRPAANPPNHVSRSHRPTDTHAAPLCQLLWLHLHPVGALHALPQRPLVHGQA